MVRLRCPQCASLVDFEALPLAPRCPHCAFRGTIRWPRLRAATAGSRVARRRHELVIADLISARVPDVDEVPTGRVVRRYVPLFGGTWATLIRDRRVTLSVFAVVAVFLAGGLVAGFAHDVQPLPPATAKEVAPVSHPRPGIDACRLLPAANDLVTGWSMTFQESAVGADMPPGTDATSRCGREFLRTEPLAQRLFIQATVYENTTAATSDLERTGSVLQTEANATDEPFGMRGLYWSETVDNGTATVDHALFRYQNAVFEVRADGPEHGPSSLAGFAAFLCERFDHPA